MLGYGNKRGILVELKEDLELPSTNIPLDSGIFSRVAGPGTNDCYLVEIQNKEGNKSSTEFVFTIPKQYLDIWLIKMVSKLTSQSVSNEIPVIKAGVYDIVLGEDKRQKAFN